MTEPIPYPAWICSDCGEKYGYWPDGHTATWHPDICDWCGIKDTVTEPRDFRYPPHPDRIKRIERAVLVKAMALFTIPVEYTKMECSTCGFRRAASEDEINAARAYQAEVRSRPPRTERRES